MGKPKPPPLSAKSARLESQLRFILILPSLGRPPPGSWKDIGVNN